MGQPRKSYAENRKEVYKFWLGFLEKLELVLIGVVLLPQITGALQYSPILLIWAGGSILVVVAIMLYLSRILWYLKKDRADKEN